MLTVFYVVGMGLLLVLLAVLLLNDLPQQPWSASALQKMTGLPVLAQIPRHYYLGFKRKRFINTVLQSELALDEMYRIAAASLRYTSAKHPFVVLVTSSKPGEGKSSTAVALALSHAQMGDKVLLIDADLRKPSLHDKTNLNLQYGLNDYLMGHLGLSRITKAFPEQQNVFVITAGNPLNSPVTLLSSPLFAHLLQQARRHFDVTIIDSPPVSGFADALLLNALVDTCVLVVDVTQVNLEILRDTVARLQQVRSNEISLLPMKVSPRWLGKKYYQPYRHKVNKRAANQHRKKSLGLDLSRGMASKPERQKKRRRIISQR